MERLRVVVAEKDRITRKNLVEILNHNGYFVVGEAEDGISALKIIRGIQPELVLAAANLPGMSGIELAKIIEEGRLAAVVLMLDYAEKDMLYKPGDKPTIPVIIKPFDHLQLLSVLEYSHAAFARMVELEREVRKLKHDLETRKVVEKAKGLMMKTYGLSEEAAFRRIQQQSMKKRVSMKKIAEAIITAHELSQKVE